MMRLYLFLAVFSCCAMEMEDVGFREATDSFVSQHTIIAKLDAVRDRPWYKSLIFWGPNKEYQNAKRSVIEFCQKIDRMSHPTREYIEEKEDSLSVLVQAAHQVRVEQEKKAQNLSVVSKTKITVGVITIVLALSQLGISIANTDNQCQPSYKLFSDMLVSCGGCLSGCMLINEGVKNGDSKANAGRAAHLHLLLLEKFQELNLKSKEK